MLSFVLTFVFSVASSVLTAAITSKITMTHDIQKMRETWNHNEDDAIAQAIAAARYNVNWMIAKPSSKAYVEDALAAVTRISACQYPDVSTIAMEIERDILARRPHDAMNKLTDLSEVFSNHRKSPASPSLWKLR